jgi:hypothetical protein
MLRSGVSASPSGWGAPCAAAPERDLSILINSRFAPQDHHGTGKKQYESARCFVDALV